MKLVINDKLLFLYLIEKVIDDMELLKAKKMLKFAKKRRYFERKYYDLNDRHKKLCRREKKFDS